MIDRGALRAANAPLNAFVDFDEGATGGDGSLSGMTIGVKSNIAVTGLPWTGGIELFRNRIAETDAKAVADLRAAGATILGTLNMEEAALGAKTDNPWFGATQNPHRIGHTPGGSSGGSGAAVAAGLCDVALGTDTLGSVRIPSAYCGVYGLKPTHGAVSQDGFEMIDASLDTIGPLARSLDDLEAASRIMLDMETKTRIDGVAVLDGLGGVQCEDAVLKAYDTAQSQLASTTAFSLLDPLTRIRFAGFIMAARALHTHLTGARKSYPDAISDHLKLLIDIGANRTAEDWAEDRAVAARTRDSLREVVAAHGAVLMPTAPQAAFPHSDKAPSNQADFTCLANLSGLPAISIPAGLNADGLPVAVQLIGAAGNEAGLLDLARTLDSEIRGYRPPALFHTLTQGEPS